MPTYEYDCERCGRIEALQKMSDPPLTICPTCGGPVKKRFSAGTGVIMKGGGATGGGGAPPCDRDRPCCGRDTRCDQPGCHSDPS